MPGAPPVRVVVADDDDDVRAMLAEYLTTRGADVLQAANGLEALLHVKRGRPQAVVIDLQMPRLGGLEAIPRIRAFDPSIAIVIASGMLDADVERKAMSLGVRAVLPKPVMLPDLARALGLETAAPAAPALASPVTFASPRERAASPAKAGVRILVVDDDAEVRGMLAEILTLSGYPVRSVPDAAAALRAVVDTPPDVILLDIDMPGLSGIDALPALRAVAPRAAVIMVSGTPDPDRGRRALANGAFDYITKPVDFDHLAQTLETAAALRLLDP